MRILVCIKQVPDTTDVKINPDTGTLIREGVKSMVNPFDMYAIEEGVRLKEKYNAETVVVTMGPPQAEEALREALAMGMDKAIHLCDRAFAGSDTWATSRVISKAIEKIGEFDLILCGKQASDGDTAQVGPGVACWLDISQVCYIKHIRSIDFAKKKAVVERMFEDGYEVIETELPALLTVVKEINEPRIPSFRGMLRAKKEKVELWGQKELGFADNEVGLNGSPTQVVRIFNPPQREQGVSIDAREHLEGLDRVVEFLKGL